MYATCLHCHAPLGRNEENEFLPVGRALAFDESRGRLWVICGRCARWNLTPIETRFEAIEQCERLWRQTPTRYASGEVGLAVRPSGLRLIRIARPEREEFAYWRYGEQLRRRRRKIWLMAAVPVGIAALQLGGAAAALGIGGAAQLAQQGWTWWHLLRSRARLPHPTEPRLVGVRQYDAQKWTIGLDADGALTVEKPMSSLHWKQADRLGATFTGDAAWRALGMLMPVVNLQGAGRRDVQDAVLRITAAGDPDRYLKEALPASGRPVLFSSLDKGARLAMELTTAETRERHYLDGQLKLLAWEWQQAERIAAIADQLLLPDDMEGQLAALRKSIHDGASRPPAAP